jgi:5-methylcytosine-specific restriction endonuclease McrA
MPWSKEPGRRSSSPLKQVRAMVMRLHNGVCHLCGHGGADEVDHIIGVAQWRREQRVGDPNHPSNLAPAHGAPCLVCGKTCHKDKTQSEAVEARWGARRRPGEQHPGII